MEKRFINRDEAAEYLTNNLGLRVSKNTLQKYVTTGGGPEYQRFGRRAVYTTQGLSEWAEQKISASRLVAVGRHEQDQ